jgi:hypothetical protein
MGLLDVQLVLSNNQSLAIAAPGAASQGVIDLMGSGVGTPPPNYFGVQDAVFGEDIGIGTSSSGPPLIVCTIGTSFATANAATLTVQLQESVDSGPAGAPPFSPNAWQTIAQTGALSAAQLLANTQIAAFVIPPRNPGQAFPRFFQLNYVVSAGTAFTAGTIAFAGVATGRDDGVRAIYPSGF